ncbi:MAG: class I SAM-dependent methyltransferase [Leisingera sp.]
MKNRAIANFPWSRRMQERNDYTNCPLCEGSEFSEIYRGDCSTHPGYSPLFKPEIHWNKCNSCMHVFTSGYFTDAAFEVLFSTTPENRSVGYKMEEKRAISAKMIEKALPYTSSGPWLDIGFGNASLLFTAREFGFEPIGVDLRRDNVLALQKIGIEAYCEDIQQLNLGRKCSVVSIMDVLEHVPHPKPFLRAAAGFLETGSPMLISMPNSESFAWDYATGIKQNPYWGELEHFHNFSRSRLYSLLEEVGMKPVRFGLSERYRLSMEVVAVKA